jgi:hypothetical protein
MWTKATTDTATQIGERAATLIATHDGGHAFTDLDLHLIARACALAADEVQTGRRLDVDALAHADGFADAASWRAWWSAWKRPIK